MAITEITLTIVSVREILKDLHEITLNMVCLDGVKEVINESRGVKFRPTQDVGSRIGALEEEFQAIINEYKGEQTIFDLPGLDTQISTIEASLRTANLLP